MHLTQMYWFYVLICVCVCVCVCVCAGYGFVDFDSPAAAQKAVTALKASGVQAQMAKVDFYRKKKHEHNVHSAHKPHKCLMLQQHAARRSSLFRDVTIHSTHNSIRFTILISRFDFLTSFLNKMRLKTLYSKREGVLLLGYCCTFLCEIEK